MSKMSELDYEQRMAADQPRPEEYQYELIGTIDGSYGGRWVVSPLNPAAVWPDGMALYVRRRVEE